MEENVRVAAQALKTRYDVFSHRDRYPELSQKAEAALAKWASPIAAPPCP